MFTFVELGFNARPVRSKKILHEYCVISAVASRLPTHPSLAQTFEHVVCCAMPHACLFGDRPILH